MQCERGDLQGGTDVDRWLQKLHLLGVFDVVFVRSSLQGLAAFVWDDGCTPVVVKWAMGI